MWCTNSACGNLYKQYIMILAFCVCIHKMQAQNVRHIAGIDAGYSHYPSIVGFKGEANLNYVFNPYNFMVKAQLGIAPATNFGTMSKGFVSIGYTTCMDRFVSWHLLTGAGGVLSEKNNPDYNFEGGPVILESGFYIKPLKETSMLIGINASFFPFYYKGKKDIHRYSNGIVSCVNISYSLILNGKKKKLSQ